MKKHFFKITGLLSASVLILCFQNCSDMVVQDSVVYQSSLAEYASNIDNENLSTLLTTDRLAYSGGGSVTKNALFMAERFSAVIAANKSATGTLLSINSGTGLDEGRVSVSSNKITAYHFSDASRYTSLTANVPSEGDKMVIAVSFGIQPKDITLLVNGVVQTGTITTTGVPTEFSYVDKTVTLGNVLDAMVYSVPADENLLLTPPQLNVMSRYIASENSIANVIYDPSLMNYQDDSTVVAPDPLLVAAKAVVDTNCTSCHSNLVNLTLSKAISSGWVVKGSLSGSKLYSALKGAGVSGGRNDMPQGGQLSAADRQKIADWILSIK
ncbi:cytochrome c [Bdellovibrio sp. NC01]|uniref:c-type cytochrome n=1 Tax=Bdellovibrio sp. NC01 TaxID=2220073 RepID=UPI001159334C|nr:cytochrome c [Bdellovibrio sp. NC01]QDK38356.1 hypothetical protein DOE51_12575 [Bdellovibrio sp. NC01]